MEIIGFYHIYMINTWENLVNEQLQKIIHSNLYEISKKIYISCLGDNTQKLILEKIICDKHKFEIIFYHNDGTFAEIPILQHLQDLSSSKEFYAWYIHTKGITSGQVDWRKEMETLVILNNRQCINVLNKNKHIGACGPRLTRGGFPFDLSKYGFNHQYHFSGNFWWAKSTYIKKINIKLSEVWKDNKKNRLIAEAFIGMLPSHDGMMNLTLNYKQSEIKKIKFL